MFIYSVCNPTAVLYALFTILAVAGYVQWKRSSRAGGDLSVEPVRRVVITGSESTGKTTLATRLAERYDTVATPEFSRDYAAERSVPLDGHDVEAIALGQIQSEDRWTRRARHDLIVLDTDLFSTVVYGRHYYGSLEPWIERADPYPARRSVPAARHSSAVGGGFDP